MKKPKKTTYLTFCIIILIILLTTTPLHATYTQNYLPIKQPQKNILYVDDNNTKGPWHGTIKHPYQFITQAIENAQHNYQIYIFNGTYNETLTITKPLTIQGENTNTTTIDGKYSNIIIQIQSENVTIKNLTIRNSGGYNTNAAIKTTSPNTSIQNCIIYRTRTAIELNQTKNCSITNCTLHTNGAGIHIIQSQQITVNNNNFCHNALGIETHQSHDINIDKCYLHTNGVGIFSSKSNNIRILQTAIYDHNDNQGGSLFQHSNNISLINCNVIHNGFATRIRNCSSMLFSHCDYKWNTHSAISVETSTRNLTIDNCNITNSFRYSLYITNLESKITNSNLYSSLVGIRFEKSTCDLRNNWWGSPLGPSLFEHPIRDRICYLGGKIRIFPWLTKQNTYAGSNWEINYQHFQVNTSIERYQEISLPGDDNDNDLCPNWWEEKWNYNPNEYNDHQHLDPDNDGLNNLEECYTDQWNSNPFKQDIFIEFDWMEPHCENADNKPSERYKEQLISKFADHNITLHLDTGNLDGGEVIPYKTNFSYDILRDMYWDYFLHNDLNNPRKGIFHYCLIADYGPLGGFSFFGWDQLDSFEISAQIIQNNHPQLARDWIIIMVTFHELGHTLGLFVDDHAGIDNQIATKPLTIQWWKNQNYRSCMHYRYTYKIFDYSDGTHGQGDFNDWENLDFVFFKQSHFEWPK